MGGPLSWTVDPHCPYIPVPFSWSDSANCLLRLLIMIGGSVDQSALQFDASCTMFVMAFDQHLCCMPCTSQSAAAMILLTQHLMKVLEVWPAADWV